MDFSVQSLHTFEFELSVELQTVLNIANVKSTTDLNKNSLMKLCKNDLTDIVLRLVKAYEKNLNICKSEAVKIDQLKSDQIENQKKIMEIHDKQIDSVQQTVKTELKTWADVAKKGITSKPITKHTVKEAVRSVNDEEKRSKCFLIYGVEEKDNEMPCEIANNVYRKLKFNPPKIVDSYRVGRRTPGKSRPIKVELKHPTDALVLLKNAGKLRSTDMSSVYLSPDRNKQEQAAHSKLVAEMRTMIKEDPSKFYFIRNNKVNFIDKK